ncbi:hypothetical protein CKAH01_03586 [Colletotrichum kahawae]|uniref:Uncharacterized protein n=1 Tax=Colletotrichum kahawae TaxID=34407 RepID=A0AAD9YSU1_COLKA|nr:hypothetical protein CKAH01_03586 [Colletotrichum kahawae]
MTGHEDTGSPLPCLVGGDLERFCLRKCDHAYLVLLINDWSGDSAYITKKFFSSLLNHKYNRVTQEVTFEHSGLTLHIGDAICATNECWVPFARFEKLFCAGSANANTLVLNYKENAIREIPPELIGGVQSGHGKDTSRACSLRLEFREGNPVYRVLYRPTMMKGLINIERRDQTGRKWVVAWRAAEGKEKSYWS